MNKRFSAFLLLSFLVITTYATIAGDNDKDKNKKKEKMQQTLQSLPDSAYDNVKEEDLLNDEVYIKLARDGWSSEEIEKIMDDYLKYNRSKVRGSLGYGMYAKQWLPMFGHTPGNDSIYQFVDTTYNENMLNSIRSMYSADMAEYYEPIPYTPDDRTKGKRNKGYFRQVLQKPHTGRVHWIVVHPDNPDKLMVVPDGAGIFRTDDCGVTWDCVTDRIPDREFRKICSHSAIPVDPDNWDHFFAFMRNGNETRVYETTDGGQNWTRVEGAKHYNFKRGYGFRDKNGTFKFIGAQQRTENDYMNNKLWISEDKGVTWTEILIPDSLKELRPESTHRGAFLQNFAFDPTDRDKIYFTSSRSIYYFDDGARPVTVNGKKTYNVKRMKFNVYEQDGTTIRERDTYEFPYDATTQAFLEVNPNNPKQMWFATATRNVTYGVYSAVYRSDDGGQNWITLQEPYNKIGSGLAFGNESPWGWLGGFGVNFADTTYLYGCSMSSAKSTNGGRDFKEFAWGNRLKALHEDGKYYYTTSSRHNADNHCIVSHKSGRVFRGSDSGLLMIDPAVNDHEWTSINGTMGNQLHYSIKVNEFGDQTMLGNTQDVDAQTYKYGRWGNWRGYEGTEAFINPYSGTCYFSGGGGGSIENIVLSSWYEGFTLADVMTGNWYLIHRQEKRDDQSFFRISDFGHTADNISLHTVDETGTGAGARDFAITRDGDTPTLFVVNMNHTIMRSKDNGETFETVKVNGNTPAKFSNCYIAADPDNSNILYVAKTGMVHKYDLAAGTYEDLSAGLQNISCDDIIFHEGSGDLYFYSKAGGIYRRDHKSGQWELWMKGYNPLETKNIVLNYTTQEMVIADYGRGIWVADLENPSDRYFKEGFALKELSNVDGRRTIGIDTKWTIPMYYNYTWTVNGEDVSNPYQYLTMKLNQGDRVQLKLTLRESPDVSTTSEVFVVSQTTPETTSLYSGNALYSDGSGRVDLGYVDYFLDDFTIEMWVKPETDGVLLSNRPVELEKDTRGWAIMIEGGNLKFRYAPANIFDRATYDENTTQQTDLNAGLMTFGEWVHIAVTEERNGSVKLYVNGKEKASAERIVKWAPLNSAMYLSLFADGFEKKAIKAAVDELKIWNYALTDNDVKRVMYSHSSSNTDGLVYYNSFNASKLDEDHELFSRKGMQSRTRANTEYIQMYHPVAATHADVKTLSEKTLFSDKGSNIMYVSQTAGTAAELGVYKYVRQGDTIPGIDKQYYTPVSAAYVINNFSEGNEDSTFDLDILLDNNSNEQYQLYAADINAVNKIWSKISSMTSADGNTLSAKGVKGSDLKDKLLVILKNKAAIEPFIAGDNNNNEIYFYDESDIDVEMRANLVGGLEEPDATYPITSKQGIVAIRDFLKFSNNVAVTKLTVNADKLQDKKIAYDTIVGKNDNRMIPLVIKVINKSLPKEIGNSTTIHNGGLQVGTPSVYGRLNGKNTMTMMAWVRIDDESVLTGVKPLIFFRGGTSKPTGLHLTNGNLRLHWNDGEYNSGTYLTIKREDLGRWMHVALVSTGSQFKLYLNGVENVFTRTIKPAQIGSPLMLGQNYSSDKWFNGAFDQVSVWDKALSADEVKYYMQKAPKLNEEGLVAFVNMDNVTEDGEIVESVTETYLTKIGTVTTGTPSNAPYNYKEYLVQEGNATESGQKIHITQPAGKNIRCHFSIFEGNAYNYISQEHPELSPLISEHYTIIYDAAPGFTSNQTVKLTFNMPQFTTGTAMPKLAIRPIGSEAEFTTFVEASEISEGKAVFTMTGDQLNEAKEFIVLSDMTAGTNPVKVALSTTENCDSLIILDSTKDKIKLSTKVLSKNPDSHVTIAVTETSYATINKEALNMNVSEESFEITIDKEKIDKLGINPVTVKLSGVSEPVEMTFNVALEPILELTLAEGSDDTVIVDETTTSLPVKARLTQGVILGSYSIVTETADHLQLGSVVNTGIGDLLSNNNVTVKDHLEFHQGVAETEEGWNLIGNPYLSNINMTKEQNVVIDESYVLKYLYQYNADNDTYSVWDMVESYDPTHVIAPFQAFFIQTKQEGASLTITPVAKDTTINRKVFSHFMMEDNKKLRISLFAGESDKESDHTDIRLSDDASEGFVHGEDAVKMWGGLNGRTNEIAVVYDGKYLAINDMPYGDAEIPLYLRASSTGAFRIAATQLIGFSAKDKIELVDKKTGAVWSMAEVGAAYEFEVADAEEAKNRFVIRITADKSGMAEEGDTGKCYVLTDGNECIVKDIPANSSVEIFDLAGIRHVYETNVEDTYSTTLDNGKYIVRVKNNNKEYTTKIIIQK